MDAGDSLSLGWNRGQARVGVAQNQEGLRLDLGQDTVDGDDHLTDRLGRKRLFLTTLAVYLVATAATALAWDFRSFMLFRFLTGAGIGGEYAAINSAIQELIPARVRGWS